MAVAVGGIPLLPRFPVLLRGSVVNLRPPVTGRRKDLCFALVSRWAVPGLEEFLRGHRW